MLILHAFSVQLVGFRWLLAVYVVLISGYSPVRTVATVHANHPHFALGMSIWWLGLPFLFFIIGHLFPGLFPIYEGQISLVNWGFALAIGHSNCPDNRQPMDWQISLAWEVGVSS